MDSNLHFYSADVSGTVIRFLVIHKRSGEYGAALDACQICGAQGYRQEGSNIICRNCAAAIYIPSIGDRGGCNPIGVKSRVEGGELLVVPACALEVVGERCGKARCEKESDD